MTAGHKHRIVHVKRGGLIHRVLTRPLYTTANVGWVDRSRLVFGPVDGEDRYYLSLLGLAHGLCGLTLRVD